MPLAATLQEDFTQGRLPARRRAARRVPEARPRDVTGYPVTRVLGDASGGGQLGTTILGVPSAAFAKLRWRERLRGDRPSPAREPAAAAPVRRAARAPPAAGGRPPRAPGSGRRRRRGRSRRASRRARATSRRSSSARSQIGYFGAATGTNQVLTARIPRGRTRRARDRLRVRPADDRDARLRPAAGRKHAARATACARARA